MFRNAMSKVSYEGDHHYCYCTKSSQFKFVIEQALKSDVHLETSSAYDLDLIRKLEADKLVDKYNEYLGADASVLRPQSERDEIRQARAQAQARAEQQAQAQAAMQQLPQAAKALGDTPVGGEQPSALDALLGGIGGY